MQNFLKRRENNGIGHALLKEFSNTHSAFNRKVGPIKILHTESAVSKLHLSLEKLYAWI